MSTLLKWDIYQITAQTTKIHGVMFRGRIRKLGLENGFNVLTENASDIENCVRFAVLSDADQNIIADYLKTITSDVNIELVAKEVVNPVLSKLKVNKEDRYTL